jgi:hypothetical protein
VQEEREHKPIPLVCVCGLVGKLRVSLKTRAALRVVGARDSMGLAKLCVCVCACVCMCVCVCVSFWCLSPYVYVGMREFTC